jgi:hypothetical protein
MREWWYGATILGLVTRWKLSGQIHAPAALPPEKHHPVAIEYKNKPVWALCRRENSATAAKQTQAVQPVAHRYTD